MIWDSNDAFEYNRLKRKGNPNCDCASACFLIWASGIVRYGNVVGIHRPYFEPSHFRNLSGTEARQAYNVLRSKFRDYLYEIEVPNTIIDTLFASDSTKMHYLSQKEIDLMTSVPFIEESIYARCGPYHGKGKPWDQHASTDQEIKYNICMNQIYKEVMIKGVADYKNKYGN